MLLYYVNKEDFGVEDEEDSPTINEGYTLITSEQASLEYQAP